MFFKISQKPFDPTLLSEKHAAVSKPELRIRVEREGNKNIILPDSAEMERKYDEMTSPPRPLTILSKKIITHSDAKKAVTFWTLESCEFANGASEPGDAFGVVCCNDGRVVEAFLHILGIDGELFVKCRNSTCSPAASKSLLSMIDDHCLKVRDLFLNYIDINYFPKKSCLRNMAYFCQDPTEQMYLLWLASPKGSQEYMNLAHNHVNIMDFFYTFSSCRMGLEYLLGELPLLYPRFYSNCSSDRRTLCFISSPMVFEKDGKKQLGVASRFLAEQMVGDKLLVFPKSEPAFREFSDHASSGPLLMVCAGTGISPFLGSLLALKQPVVESWLVFGFRHLERDFLFKDELEVLVSSKKISRLSLACSQQPESGNPKYVQDHLLANSEAVYKYLLNGRIYICGEELTMVRGVNDALGQIILEHEAADLEGDAKKAQKKLALLAKERRIIKDIWV